MNATIKEYHNDAGIVEGVEIMKEDGTVVVIGDVTQWTSETFPAVPSTALFDFSFCDDDQ